MPSKTETFSIVSSRQPTAGLATAIGIVAALAVFSGCKNDRGDDPIPKPVDPDTNPLCNPACDGTTCGDDGCGGVCACAAGTVCNADHLCVDPSACQDTCAAAGWECGVLCGQPCGNASGGCVDASAACFWNGCYVPPVASSCATCSLKLTVLSKTVSASGNITEVKLAVDYDPEATEPKPRMIDLRLYSNKPVTLTQAVEGQALVEASKNFYTDPITNRPWKARADRSFQLLLLSLTNTNVIGPGRIAELTFTLDDPGPVPFRILPGGQVFAPPDADTALHSTSFADAVVVTNAN